MAYSVWGIISVLKDNPEWTDLSSLQQSFTYLKTVTRYTQIFSTLS